MSLIPIIVGFLWDTVDSSQHPDLAEHVTCFVTLWQIVGICSLGPVDAVPYVDLLRTLIEKHGALFVTLYGQHVKPKFHHLLHIPENIESLVAC